MYSFNGVLHICVELVKNGSASLSNTKATEDVFLRLHVYSKLCTGTRHVKL